MPTSGGSSDSETSEPTVVPNRWPSTATVTSATPAGKRRIAARSSSPPATWRSYGRSERERALRQLGVGRPARAERPVAAEDRVDDPPVVAGHERPARGRGDRGEREVCVVRPDFAYERGRVA